MFAKLFCKKCGKVMRFQRFEESWKCTKCGSVAGFEERRSKTQ